MSEPNLADSSSRGQPAASADVGDDGGRHGNTPPPVDGLSGDQSPIPVETSPSSSNPDGTVGDNVPSSVGQDTTSRPASPQSVVSRTGVLILDEVVSHVRAGVLPSRDRSSPGMQNTPPARFTLPPARNLVGDSFIVGVPAHALAYRNGAYVREGYGGVEALMLFDGLSEVDIQDLCTLVGDSAEGEYDRLKEDFVFLYGYHQQETQFIRDEASHARGVLEADFARLARENLEETAVLRQRNDDLESQLRYTQTQISTLEQRVRDKSFDADGLLAFLNSGSNEVRGNWPRLRRLLSQFQRDVSAPPSWKTWITVEAADKSFRMIPPYPGPAPPDSDADDEDDAEQEEKSEENPPSPETKRDTPRGKEPRKSQAGSKRRSSSQRVVGVEIQCRPTVLPESGVGPRPASQALTFTVREACALLPEFIAWEDLRPDVQWTMRTGVGYDEAVELMLADSAQHHLFHRDSLCSMLAAMMYHRKLDDTPWARYVPTSYYLMADVLLENWLEQGKEPAEWPDLRNLTDDLPDISDSSSSEEEDNLEDPDFDGPVPERTEVDPPKRTRLAEKVLHRTATS
ncbi:hypothetical protein PR001_g21833 [Phytophthora rubi]|uniref:Uncharacterized protein n=1 Tax=Phytophthora rubi TaxID=129364 RepID=A0A6A3J1X9_9STRA|nr:hypothetical protein PR001_g21833 [Phytophthora rubi]